MSEKKIPSREISVETSLRPRKSIQNSRDPEKSVKPNTTPVPPKKK